MIILIAKYNELLWNVICDPSIAIRAWWHGTNVEIWYELDVQRPVCMHLEICELHLLLISHNKYVNILYNKQNDKHNKLTYYTTSTLYNILMY